MAKSASDRIGQTLAKLASLSTGDRAESLAGAAGPSGGTSRSQVLQTLTDTPDGCSVDEICAITDLHANTVRGQLELLRSGGHIVRFAGEREGRGRPPWRYALAPERLGAQQRLADELVEQLLAANDENLARNVAHKWAQITGEPTLAVVDAETPDGVVAAVVESLRRLGFQANSNVLGDAVLINDCPYGDLVRDYPVICDIHAELMVEELGSSGQGVSFKELEVFPSPGLCVARLNRADRVPVRRVSASDVDRRTGDA